MNKVFLLLIPVVISFNLYAQKAEVGDFDVEVKYDGSKKCNTYEELMEDAPWDVSFGISINDGKLYLYATDENYFDQLFDSKYDGFAIDAVSKRQFPCDAPNRLNPGPFNGKAMKPLYRGDFKDRIIRDNNGNLFVEYGKIPIGIKPDDVEFNLLILQNKMACHYGVTYNLERVNFDILEMGFYKDSTSQNGISNRYRSLNKRLRFEVPFKKNKMEFKDSDIQPMVDTLNFTDYDIKSITIKAYSSVEGSYENNVKLQNGRAQSIVDLLQQHQNRTIISDIKASENWVEFFNDIEDTDYADLRSSSKDEIKRMLLQPELLEQLEPILKHHRKAVIDIDMESKLLVDYNDPIQLKALFNKSIEEKNLDEAYYLQEIIFEKVRNASLPDRFLNELEIPQTITYLGVLNNMALFEYEHLNDLNEAIDALKRLEEIDPKNERIKYNTTALFIQSWKYNIESDSKREKIASRLKALERSKTPYPLVRRMWINYHIILTQYKFLIRDYEQRNKSMKFVTSNYEKEKLNDKDALTLAKYFSFNSNLKEAIRLVYPRATQFQADEELLFYFINLSFFYLSDYTDTEAYRIALENARDANKERFCQLFGNSQYGGVSFQLLSDDYLKDVYCENCK
ncbi:MAG: hypothetical protein AAFX87_25255 [Bacteroidota bacterium]